MIPYYSDNRKYLVTTKNPITRFRRDKDADQFVHITGSVFGVEIRPGLRWTSLCEKLFRQMGANGVRLEDISSAPGENEHGSVLYFEHYSVVRGSHG
jgi:hypothetical protein